MVKEYILSMYNYYRQQPYQTRPATYQPQMPVQQGLKGRPVSSVEEARAASIDFDGSIFYFPDVVNKKIYTKQIDFDGLVSINMYELVKTPISPSGGNFITREEFESAINQLKSSLQPVKSSDEAATAQSFNF